LERQLNKTLSPNLTSNLLTRNTLINFFGQLIPIIFGIITTPFIIQGLGTDRFGLLSMVWVILGYFAIFDLGMGRATTKYLAEILGKDGQDDVSSLVWSAVSVQFILGILGALILIISTPLLVERVLNISFNLINEARATLYIIAIALPIVFISGSFSGVLEANQRFDLVNIVNIPANSLIFILPLVGIWFGMDLKGIIFLLLLVKVGSLLAYIRFALIIHSNLRYPSFSLSLMSSLFSYGGWIAVGNNVMNPILINLDRFLIGSLISMNALAYYSAPYEIVTRLGMIPASLTLTLFPAFSTLQGTGDRRNLSLILFRSVKYVLLTLGPIVIILEILAPDILNYWLGKEFASESTIVLQILVVGGLINSLARIPSTLFSSAGRPDLPAKFRLLEFPIYAILAWLFINEYGIKGAAIAWSIRLLLDAVLLFLFVPRVYSISRNQIFGNNLMIVCILLVFLIGLMYLFSSVFELSFITRILILSLSLGFLIWSTWIKFFDDEDRKLIMVVIAWGKKLGSRIAV
jgi:O-antigen/teichoic acid export membrane protein